MVSAPSPAGDNSGFDVTVEQAITVLLPGAKNDEVPVEILVVLTIDLAVIDLALYAMRPQKRNITLPDGLSKARNGR